MDLLKYFKIYSYRFSTRFSAICFACKYLLIKAGLVLRCNDTPPCFPDSFTKRNNCRFFLLAFLEDIALPKCGSN